MSAAGSRVDLPASGSVVRRRAAARGVTLRRHAYPLLALVRREVRRRYATTFLGVGWTVLQPIVLLLIYVLVFAFILPRGSSAGSGTFVFYLLAGLLPYLALAEGIQRASTSLRDDRGLLEQPEFPAEVVPLSRVVSATLNEVIGLALLVAIGTAFGAAPGVWVLALPLLILIRLALTTGVAWIVSMLAVFVADLAEVLSLLLTGWLFLTPIFYRAEDVPGALQWLLIANPLHAIVEAYRDVLLEHRAPWPHAAVAAAWAAASVAAGLWFFRRTIRRGRDFL